MVFLRKLGKCKKNQNILISSLRDGFSEQKKYETQLIYIVLLTAKTKYIYNNAGQIAFLSTYRTIRSLYLAPLVILLINK
jgi:hypothetical protein